MITQLTNDQQLRYLFVYQINFKPQNSRESVRGHSRVRACNFKVNLPSFHIIIFVFIVKN